ncbi:hypothetical protein [Gymnodinialimonas hymeniacidonis]|uniref:hypothetical protein n=1 Tax=Gymnodinialimonas hymeniacidonis TaxID=3126508 RepID=UPI0034C5BB89
MRILALFLVLFCAACTPQSGTLSSPALGAQGDFTEQIAISDHPHHVLMGHVIDFTQNGARTRALVIGQRRDGVHRLRMSEAWNGGTALPFTATHRRLDGCTHGHCRDNAVGMILLSDALFQEVRATGLTARLIGTSDAINIRVPATLFRALPE